MTFACATDGNHGRSVAQGAQLVGATGGHLRSCRRQRRRVAAIARFGAEMVRVAGTYDDSVTEAARVSAEKGWTVVSDTSWPGYERIPGLVMQGYTAMVREALRQIGDAADACVRAGRRRRRRGGRRGPSGARVRRQASDLRRGRSGARRLHLRDRQGRTSGEDRAWRADRDGDARMLRALAARVARAVARRGRLHDGRGCGCGRGDEPPRAPGRRRSRASSPARAAAPGSRARSARRPTRRCARSSA